MGEDAAQLAALICRLHRDEKAHRQAVRAGRALIRTEHNETVVTTALQAAIEGRGVPAQHTAASARITTAA